MSLHSLADQLFEDENSEFSPAIFGSPSRYIQAPGLFSKCGEILSSLGYSKVAVMASLRSQQIEASSAIRSIETAGLAVEISTFGGECSFEEIEKHTKRLTGGEHTLDAVVAIGGGKVVDAGKCVAARLGIEVIILPSLASNDGPCSALSVIYDNNGSVESAEVFNVNPRVVMVDTEVIARAPVRYLVAGIGDALATWYEARACAENPRGKTVLGGRPTLAGTEMGRLCADTIFEYAIGAISAVQNKRPSIALEKVVEANILLSGIGFESGGVAASHAFANAFSRISETHISFLHGEMVAVGVLSQLALEDDEQEAQQVTEFFAEIGLPTTLAQIGLSNHLDGMQSVANAAADIPFLQNMPIDDLSAEALLAALAAADARGTRINAASGADAYRALHSN